MKPNGVVMTDVGSCCVIAWPGDYSIEPATCPNSTGISLLVCEEHVALEGAARELEKNLAHMFSVIK